MKKGLIALLSFFLIFSSFALAEDIPGKGMFYEYEDFEAEITGTYLYSEAGQDYILIAVHWKNLYSEPLSFVYTFFGHVYQDGIEVPFSPVGAFDMKGITNILPGAELDSYTSYEINGDGEVFISLRAFGDMLKETDPIEYTVIPSELPIFDISMAP